MFNVTILGSRFGKLRKRTLSKNTSASRENYKKDRVIEKEYSKFKQIMDVKREAKPKKGKNPSEKATG